MHQRCVEIKVFAKEPASGFPGTRLDAFLKQISVDELPEQDRHALDQCFPQFASLRDVSKHIVNELGSERVVTSGGIYDPTVGRARRYGGTDLPGGRYYSVCQNETGGDKGTLCFELSSYWTSETGVFTGLTDFTTHHAALDAMGVRKSKRDPVLLVTISDLARIRVLGSGGLDHGEEPSGFALPLKIVHLICDNVLDLRRPSAQDWLAERFSEGHSEPIGFQHLICNLMSPYPGGNAFHQSIGEWLRSHGCLGLVYPSARCEVLTDASDTEIAHHQGWSFVLYHGAPEIPRDRKLQSPFPWLDANAIGVEVLAGSDEGRRIWIVRGAETREWGRIYYEVRRSRGEAPPPGPLFNPYYESGRAGSRYARFFASIEPD